MTSSRKTVLITGGSSGVGAELVKVFAEQGYTVWFTYNSGRRRADDLISSLPTSSDAQVSDTLQHCSMALVLSRLYCKPWLTLHIAGYICTALSASHGGIACIKA